MEASDADLVVVGGGISGLATAWYAKRLRPDWRIVVLEASPRVGGKILGGMVAGGAVELGPDSFLARVPWLTDLCNELGLAEELEAPATGQAWVWSRGQLRALPAGLVLGVPTRLGPVLRSGIVSPRAVARAALDELRPVRLDAADPSVREAVGRHLGHEIVDRLVDPLLGGINAGDSTTLSLAIAAPQLAGVACAPRLMRALRAATATTAGPARSAVRLPTNTGSLAHNAAGPVFLRPRGGIGRIPQRLAEHLDVRTDTPVHAVAQRGSGWLVTGAEVLWHTPNVVLTTPANVSARLIDPFAGAAAVELRAIRYASVALVVLAYPRHNTHLPPGSGFLVPRVERRLITAGSWWDQKWPGQRRDDVVIIRASVGRDGVQEALAMEDHQLVRRVDTELVALLGSARVAARPVDAVVARWPDGFPQFDVGHGARVARLRSALAADAPGIEVAGAAFGGVGLATCVREARDCAARITA